MFKLKNILNSYIFLLTISFLLGFFIFHDTFSFLYQYNINFLQVIVFISSLKIDFKDFIQESKKIKDIAWVNALTLIILPIVFYYIFKFTIPDIAIPAMLLMIVPIARTAPLFTEMVGGNIAFSTMLTTINSFIAILSIPTILYFLLGNSVNIDYFSILIDTINVILLPILFAQIFKYIFKKNIEKTYKFLSPISTFVLIIILTSILAYNKELLIKSFDFFMVRNLIILFLIFIILHFIGIIMSYKNKNRKDKIAIIITSVYMNFALSIYLCHKFFPNENISFLIISMIPWAILFPIFQYLINKKHLIN